MTARRIGLLLVVAIMVGLLNSSVFATGLGFSWPVSNSNRSITQPYHLANELGYSFEHRGIDLIGDRGIYATESGTIVLSGWDTYGCGTADEAGWNNLSEAQRTSRSCGGYMVKVKHSVPSGTNYHSLYAHLVRGCYLTGGSVTKGQQLGVMGESGYVTGRHLHYELRTAESHDSAINPSSDLTTEPAMTSIFPCLYLTGNVVVSPNPAAEKDALTITIPVTNMGPAATVEKIDVTMRTGTGATWKYGTSSPIAFAQAESKVITISGPAWEGHAGSWQITSIDYRYLTDKWRGVDANGKTLTTSFVVNASPPRLELTGDVTMSAYTVTGGQSVSFSVPVKNWGGNLTMTDSYLDVTTSNGSIWKATGVNQNIAANGTTTLTFSGQLWQTPGGTWTVHEVSYKDSGGVWRQVGRGDNRILARSFTVIPPDTQPPTDVFILEPANGSTLGTGTHGVRISAKDTVGVTTVTLYLYTQPSMGASFLMNSLSVPLQSGTAQDGIWRTEIDPGQYGAGNYSIFKYQVIAKDAAGNSTTSGLQQYTLDRRDLPPSVVTINEPASGVTIIGEPHAVMIHAVDAQAVSYVTLYVYYPETTGGSDVMHVYNVPFHHGTAQDGYWRMEHYPFSNHAVPTTNMKFQARACDSANQCSFSGLNSGITLQR